MALKEREVRYGSLTSCDSSLKKENHFKAVLLCALLIQSHVSKLSIVSLLRLVPALL